MMNFRTITQAIIDLLGDNAGTSFQVVGYRRQSTAATEIKGSLRTVQVFFSEGDFPKGSRYTGPVRMEPRWQIELSASAPAKADLTVLSDSSATATAVAAALAGASEASYEADQRLDELAELVYQILMDGLNVDLGLGKGIMSTRWVDSVRKDPPQNRGSLVVITGSISYTCVTSEDITGATGVTPDTNPFDITVPVTTDADDELDDIVQQAGVST